ncbi:MAG: helix-turn-helix domain-containing protein [Caldilineaceae bacterium]
MVIIETSVFTKQVQTLLTDEEYRQLQAELVRRPEAGAVIPGSGGLRKVRWSMPTWETGWCASDLLLGRQARSIAAVTHVSQECPRQPDSCPIEASATSCGGGISMNDELFAELLASVREGGAILRGEQTSSRRFEVSAPDVKQIREQYALSQSEFAALLGVSIKTLQNWEQGRRTPHGTARFITGSRSTSRCSVGCCFTFCLSCFVRGFLLSHPRRTSIAVDPRTVRDFGVIRPLGNGLVWDVIGHAFLGQLNVVFGLALTSINQCN